MGKMTPTGIPGVWSSFLKKLVHRENEGLGSYHQLPSATAAEGNDTRSSWTKPKAPRRGHVPMYVGEEGRRYEVPVRCLNLPELLQVMDPPPEGKIDGPLRVYCSIEYFDELLMRLARPKEV